MVQLLPSSFLSLAVSLFVFSSVQAVPTKTCVVQKSKTDDAITILQAFKDCQQGGTVVFSKGVNYTPQTLIDTPNLKNVKVQFDGTFILPNYNTKFNGGSAYLQIFGDQIQFTGHGTFVGTGQQWWDANNNQGPIVMRITATNSVFRGFRITDAPRGHLALTKCENVIVEKVYMHSVSKNNNFARNTDAIGFAWSKNIVFRDSDITNGDDCTAINGGVSNVTVTNIKCRGGHGFSIGSLGKNGGTAEVTDINIHDNQCIDCQNGIRIKAWGGGHGQVKHVRFENNQLVNTEYPIIITTNYCDKNLKDSCEKNKDQSLVFSDVYINNISGSTSWKDLPVMTIECAPKTPCEKFTIKNINIIKNKTTKPNVCSHLQGSDAIPYCKK